jgi:UDP-N-acetyl-D-galactosamine dehydrogenase
MLGYNPQVILAGRRINDGMGRYIGRMTVKSMINAGQKVKGGDAIVLGLTFKENCPDLRNSKVIDVIRELESYGLNVHVHDPVAAARDAHHEYGVRLVEWDELPRAGAIVAAVAHRQLVHRPLDEVLSKLAPGGVYADVKSTANVQALQAQGVHVWRL